jgi:hypothetical protein
LRTAHAIEAAVVQSRHGDGLARAAGDHSHKSNTRWQLLHWRKIPVGSVSTPGPAAAPRRLGHGGGHASW